MCTLLIETLNPTHIILTHVNPPQVLPLTARALEEELQRATDELLALDGQRLLSAWLDHVHSSYSSELEAAARLQASRDHVT